MIRLCIRRNDGVDQTNRCDDDDDDVLTNTFAFVNCRYPLAFTGCRDGCMDILKIPMEKRSASVQNMLTIALLSLFTFGAIVLKNVSLVMALGGATLGNLLTYVYPAMMYRAIVQKQRRFEENGAVTISMLAACLGIVMGVIGTKMALENIA